MSVSRLKAIPHSRMVVCDADLSVFCHKINFCLSDCSIPAVTQLHKNIRVIKIKYATSEHLKINDKNVYVSVNILTLYRYEKNNKIFLLTFP